MSPEEEKSKEKETKQEKQEKQITLENLGKVQDVRIEQEIQKSYIDYAMSVIVSRALPDAADGLKPVQRRILFAMHEMSLHSDKPTRKSARIVGEVMGKFHPHGDAPIYEALARMTQDFSLRYPLVVGQGNFGSIDGDPPAAQRYTEAKLSQVAEEMLADIGKETVDFRANFDNSLKEPVLLPAKIPNLLVNGTSGIAVGMATSIPPHNLSEIIEALFELIKNPQVKIEKLLEIVQGPDFPTAGYISREGIEDFYKTGRGYITMRGKAGIEEAKGRERVIITEIPFQVNKSSLVEEIARLVKDKKLGDISDIRDESSKKIRIVLELRRGANSKITINQLFNLTSMQTRFNGIMLALVDNTPRILNLKEMLSEFLKHRKNVITRRSKFELRVARDRLHIVEGLLIILGAIDKAIETIKKSRDSRDALQNLMNKFNLSNKQSEAVLDMRLARLTALEHGKLKDEQRELQARIKELEKILGSESEILDLVRKELQEVKRKHADERRTKFLEKIPTFKEKDLITKEQVVILLTAKGYIKRMPLRVYKEQQRGGRGVTGTELTTGDIVKDVFIASTHDFLLFVTNKGKAYSIQAYEIPEAERYAKGKALVNMLNLKDEKIATTLSIGSFDGNLVLITKKGMAKRMDLKNFEKIRISGIVAINLPENDELVCAKFISKSDEIIIATARGIAIHFSSDQIREVGRTAYGVTAIRMHKEDYVIGAEVLSQEKEKQEKLAVLVITEKGFGKRTQVNRYRKTARGGKGVRHIKINEKMGNVAGLLTVRDEDSLIVTTSKGMTIRTPIKNMRLAGRMTQGVRIIKIADNDKVIGLSKVSDEQ